MITADLVRQRVKNLPSLPTTVVALGQAVADDRCTVDRILSILAKDPPLSASLLRLANSIGFSGDNKVSDLRTAVMRLGYDAILNLGRTAAVIRVFRNGTHINPLMLWQHSVAVGLVAKGICRLLRKRYLEETAFLAGLLHDIGKIALDRCFTEEYNPVNEAIFAGEFCVDAEHRILGTTHAEVGSFVAIHWNFSETLVEVIRDHHEPPAGAFLTNLVNLCDLLVRSRIPNGPYDQDLSFVLEESLPFRSVFQDVPADELDIERLTFSIDDELDHAITFVQLAFQD
jgi:putative nucleotidyltransferase with HDIG domain